MRRFDIKESVQRGSLMVEALALLGLITMVTPILYKKSAERTTELQDINTATQMRILSKAVDDYIKDNYQDVGGEFSEGDDKLAFDDMEKLREYLPHGFNIEDSKLFGELEVGIRKNTVLDRNGLPHNIYTSAVLAPLREKLSIMRTSKIASMIGANGGVYRQGNADTGAPSVLTGVQGTWTSSYDDYFDGEEEGISDGSIVIISSEAISAAKGDASSEDVLYRINDGDESKNTMQTALFMGGNPIKQVASLIANGDAADSVITIGDPVANNKGGLLVLGATELKKALTVDTGGIDVNSGDVTIEAGKLTVGDRGEAEAVLYVDGDSELTGNTIVGGKLDVTGATTLESTLGVASDTTIGGKLDVEGNVTVSSNLTVTEETTLAKTTVDGDLTVTGETTLAKTTVDGDLTVTGETTLSDTTVDGALTVTGETTLSDTTVDGDLTVTGETTLESLNVADNLIANEDSVHAVKASFAIGGAVGTAGNRINIDSSSAFIGRSYDDNGTEHEGLLVDANKIVLRNAVGSLKMSDSDLVVLDNNSSRIKMDGESVVIGVGTENEEKAKIVADADKVGFENVNGENTYSIYLDTGDLTVGSKGFVIDEYGLAIAGVGGDISQEDSVLMAEGTETLDEESILNGSKVAISRKGIIEVAAPTSSEDVGGFIRARRLVSDVKYPDNGAYHGYQADGTSAPSKPYDYYQVNPAYTSVMNDIKLATRGGARLSDILPDYINKGIYIADNSYEDEGTLSTWPIIDEDTGEPETEPKECTSASCLTLPWLGFIPAPQCPKNYAKVVTMNPIKWRMAEVFSVWPDEDFYPTGQANAKEIYKENLRENFKLYFDREKNPLNAGFLLSDNSLDGDPHSHEVRSGRPLTYQINTFLNTTIEEAHIGGTPDASDPTKTHLGWHALMGFIYNPNEYTDMLSNTNTTYNEDELLWNLFPVYYGEMVANVNVYCSFDRSGTTPAPWENEVDPYDQVGNYRTGFEKSSDWSNAVNDPELGYNDAW